ncbi:MAG: NAD(P)/FAD-dependent oxidoreductase [Rhodococcus sp. (in: high G+C Gram-positive bacteria)]
MTTTPDYDVIIIGGGAAGLSSAVTLSRARRRVLVVDAGAPRNAPAAHAHNYLGLEGISPLELLAKGRQEAGSYGTEIREGTVVSTSGSLGNFTVGLADGTHTSARRLLVTTGLTDQLPDIPGVRERWGLEVLHCPFCHGWEVREHTVGIVGSAFGAHQALMWRQWADRVVLFTQDFEPTDEEYEKLAARGISVVTDKIAELVVENDAVVGVELVTGTTVDVQAVVVRPHFAANASVLTGLGIEVTDVAMNEIPMGSAVAVDQMGATSVPGVYAAGNVVSITDNIVSSAAAGARTAGAVNQSLIEDDIAQALLARAGS